MPLALAPTRPTSTHSIDRWVDQPTVGHDALVDLRLDGGEAALSRVPGTRTPREGERVGLVVTGDVPVYPTG